MPHQGPSSGQNNTRHGFYWVIKVQKQKDTISSSTTTRQRDSQTDRQTDRQREYNNNDKTLLEWWSVWILLKVLLWVHETSEDKEYAGELVREPVIAGDSTPVPGNCTRPDNAHTHTHRVRQHSCIHTVSISRWTYRQLDRQTDIETYRRTNQKMLHVESRQSTLATQHINSSIQNSWMAPWKNQISSTTMKLKISLVKPVTRQNILSCLVLPPKIVMHDTRNVILWTLLLLLLNEYY